jgi:hypothetical protein
MEITISKKSTFFFGDKIVALGSNIVNTDTVHPTETVLFQTYMPTSSMPVYLNSTTAITAPTYQNVLTGTSSAWMVDPYGNGYVIANSAGTVISRGVQNSINSFGNTATSGNYTTAYMNHGTAPSGAGYEYAIKPNAGASGTAAFASNKQYTVLQKDSNAHIVQNTTVGSEAIGYAIFNSSQPITAGVLRHTSAPTMVMIQNVSNSKLKLSMADPDLRLPHRTTISELTDTDVISPSVMQKQTLTLQGVWTLKTPNSQARVISATSTDTTIEFDCVDGKSIEVELVVPSSITSNKDSYVASGSLATQNYGNSSSVYVKNNGSGDTMETYMNFDLTFLPSNVSSAVIDLNLLVSQPYAPVQVVELVSDHAWTQNGIVWNNKPGSTGIVLATFTPSVGSHVFDVTNYVLAAMAGDKQLSIRIYGQTTASNSRTTYASREHSVINLCPELMIATSNQ